MPTVLLTRPLIESQRLAHKLEDLGYACLIDPLLTIHPVITARPPLETVEMVMITSGNALLGLAAQKEDPAHLLGLPCFCVGRTTAEAARYFGFKDVRDAKGDGKALAELVGRTVKANPQSLLYLAGQDRDGEAEELLQKASLALSPWIVYRAEPKDSLADQTVLAFNERRFDAVLLYSKRTAAALKTVLLAYRLEACCSRVTAIGISASVRDALEGLTFRKLAAAVRPNEEAMLDCLIDLVPPL